MRKSMFYSMLGMAALFLMNGCQKPAEEAPDPVINLEVTEGRYEVPAAGGEVKIAYSVENPVEGVSLKVSAAPNDWATGFKADGTNIVFNVAPKLDLDAERTVDVTASYTGAKDVTFTLVQVPDDASKRPSLKVEPSTYEASAEGGPGSVKYTLTNPVEGSELSVELADAEDASWVTGLTLDETTSTVKFSVAANNAINGRSAVVNIIYTALSSPVSFTIAQDAASIDYKENPNWKVSYLGKQHNDEDGYYDLVKVEVSSGNDTYFTEAIPVEEFDALKGGIQEYVEGIIATYDQLLDLYGLSWTNLLKTTGSETQLNVLDHETDYYAVAIGADNDGNPTGLYSMIRFTPEELEASDAYNKWLGDWRLEDETGEGFDISITVGSPDISYVMSGYQPYLEVSIPLTFDSVTGNLVFESVEDLIGETIPATDRDGVQHQALVGFHGMGDYGYVWPGYGMAEAKLSADGNSAEVLPYQYDFRNEPEVGYILTINGMEVMAVSTDSNHVWTYIESETSQESGAPALPATMTRIQSSGSATAMSVARDIKALDSKIKASVSGATTAIRMNSANMARIAR